jgi:hypothetical protein
MASNFRSTASVDFVILSIESFILFSTPLMVFDCSPEDSAGFLISPAATAKPLPASPARAASIAPLILRFDPGEGAEKSISAPRVTAFTAASGKERRYP